MVKKLLVVFLILAVCFSNFVIVYADDITLQQIADSFNNCETVKSYKEFGFEWSGEAKENELVINAKSEEDFSTFVFAFSDGVLSSEFSSGESLSGLMITSVLTDSIGQIHGYKDGELFYTLNSDQITSYTLENEGFEIKEQGDGAYIVKIDVTKKIPLADLSGVYIDEEDMDEFLIDLLKSDEPGSYSSVDGPLAYDIDKFEDTITIYFAEKDGLTSRAYNSILSFIKVIFDSDKAVNYFKENYTGIDEGNKTFNGFEVNLNVVEDDMPTFPTDFSVMKLKIDKPEVENTINDEEKNNKEQFQYCVSIFIEEAIDFKNLNPFFKTQIINITFIEFKTSIHII